MGVWDPTTPLGTDPKSQGDDRMREEKAAIQEALRAGGAEGDEAVFPGPAPLTAPIFRHRGGYGSEAARPAAAVGGQYFNTTTGTLQRSNGSAWVDITENAAFEAIHHKVAAALASAIGVVTLPETGNAFNVSGTEAVTSIAGWSAGLVIIKWTQARTLTHGASFYLMEALSRVVSAGDISMFEFTGSNAVREIAFHGAKLLPTRQTFLSGSGNYTTPAGARHLRVRVLGGGGGGGAANTNAGAAGSASSFNSIAAAGGGAGTAGGNNGPGGVGGTGGSGSAALRLPGSYGGIRGSNSAIAISLGHCGSSTMGPGAPAGNQNAAGADGLANTGGGGAGGNGDGASANWGGGGGGGEYLELNIAPTAGQVFAYAVGAGGAGGAAGTFAGGAGGSGIVIVDEWY